MLRGATIPSAVLGAVVLFVLASPYLPGSSPTIFQGSISPGVGLPQQVATVSVGPSLGVHLASPYEALLLTTDGLGPNAAKELGQFLNSTPLTVFRLSGGLDAYDPTTGIDYQAPAAGGPYTAVADPIENFTWFKAWCDSRSPHCAWIGSLPAEENNTTAAVHYADWFHRALGFAPTYWQFGNEPISWTHYGENQTRWSTTDNSTVTGPAYATMVQQYIAAIHRQFPSDRFIGMEDNARATQRR